MMHTTKIGQAALMPATGEVSGHYVQVEGQTFYKISHYDQMPPFFMSIVSSADHWLFVSSNGALTAGRRDPELALFPYYTDDKIHDGQETTGSKTLLRVHQVAESSLWEPFSARYAGLYPVSRHLYKSVHGDQLMFEETNEALGLCFSYTWCFSEQYGVVRKASLRNLSQEPVEVSVLDGLQNLMPYGVPQATQANLSTLVDAYRKSELEADSGLGLYMLSAIIVDRAEPSEALKCNSVWSLGLAGAARLISSRQLDAVRQGRPVAEETDVRAERGAYFLHKTLSLAADAVERWYMVAEVNQDAADVRALVSALAKPAELAAALDADIVAGTEKLVRLAGSADALQVSAQALVDNRHFANVLFNIMRGGVFTRNYEVGRDDLCRHVHAWNSEVAAEQAAFFEALPERLPYQALLQAAAANGHPAVVRLCQEYLPLSFSRRHGDPSRPWNKFTIALKNEDGSDALYYAGNWRDIFQNWEALGYSFPGFVEGMIAKFVNASTADGYNPYRITRNGIDWETIEPDDPWSYIGYWGDHQIIYLQKLLEVSARYYPGQLEGLLDQAVFVYANVPYRIKPYHELLANPFDTVIYDEELAEAIAARSAALGADGKLLQGPQGEIYTVTLLEKLLVPLLAKLSNFIPEAGIWLNTQRPEWNDANNALVGNGVSMVTLYYMRRFVAFCSELVAGAKPAHYALSAEVAELLSGIGSVLAAQRPLLAGAVSDRDRKIIVDGLGQAGSAYREQVYAHGYSGQRQLVAQADLLGFFEVAQAYITHSIAANERRDGLYHAYNLMALAPDGEAIAIRRLSAMLEGQVAVLSSGHLSAEAALGVLSALRQSALYRPDQHTYILYPDKALPRFMEKNNIPGAVVEASALLRRLLADGDGRLLRRDVQGGCHFHGDVRNAGDLKRILASLAASGYGDLVAQDEALLLEAFEEMFDHQSFTGRSGTFFGYEGLGSVYWHMVSKLLLAAQEACQAAVAAGAPKAVVEQLEARYYDIRAGIGFNKSPQEYGAFPSDPYSHTPAHAGAQQPGMTGQVKEDVLARFGELGLVVADGVIRVQPHLLRAAEFTTAAGIFQYIDVHGESQSLPLPEGSVAFTYCQVPFVYQRTAGAPGIRVSYADGSSDEMKELNEAQSAAIFARSGEVVAVNYRLSGLGD